MRSAGTTGRAQPSEAESHPSDHRADPDDASLDPPASLKTRPDASSSTLTALGRARLRREVARERRGRRGDDASSDDASASHRAPSPSPQDDPSATSSAEVGTAGLRVSRNLWDTLRLLASDAPLCLAALLCADVPWVLLANFSSLWPSSWHALRGSLDPQVFAGLWAAGAVTVHTVLAPFGAALVTYRALARLEGRRATLGETFRRTAPRLPAVLLAAVLSTALSALGMLLAFPGLIAMSALYVVTPVAVAEPTSGIGALRRSFRLTAGYRGRAFLLLVVLFAPLALLKLGLDAWCRGAEPGSSEYLAPTTTALFLAGRVCADVLSALSSAAAYMGLRRAFNERTSQDAPEAPEENAPSHAPATR